MSVHFTLDGRPVEAPRDDVSLLSALREDLGVREPVKDGCSPQGQCGCCTVLVDGSPRVACVTPVRRVAGRSVVTAAGLEPEVQRRLVDAFVRHGASQCGFCTPGILCRLAALGSSPDREKVETALLAHLCRCTGWRTIVDAACDQGSLGAGGAGGADRVAALAFGRKNEQSSALSHTQTQNSRPNAAEADPVATPTAPLPSSPRSTPSAPSPRSTPSPSSPRSTPSPSSPRSTPSPSSPPPSPSPAELRAALEGGVPQHAGRHVIVGAGGFADDNAPPGCLVAVPDIAGGWAVGETLEEARAASGRIQGRRSGLALTYPIDVPPGAGEWDITLQTTWVEPAYLELDSSWCEPGGAPASSVANGGAFGGKLDSIAPAAARKLADIHGRPVRVILSREDSVRLGPKRPPIAAGLLADGSGVMRIAATTQAGLHEAPAAATDFAHISSAISTFAPHLKLEETSLHGPRVSTKLRASGWAEAAILIAAADALREGRVPAGAPAEASAAVLAPNGAGASAEVSVDAGGWPSAVTVAVSCGPPLDEVTLRSFATGAAHMALGWVCSEGIAVGEDGVPTDLTIRSFGILRARDTPSIRVEIVAPESTAPPAEPVNGSDAVFAAVAAATWIAQGLPSRWPTRRGRTN
ncbi:MAG TPA: 2Fe-2S iron-sulfur cluster-binding protein [Acidimicrobiales bacterium]